MKTSLHTFLSFLLVIFTFSIGELKANPELDPNQVSIHSSTLAVDLLIPNMDNPCYPPDWTNTYNIGQNSCTWQWQTCNGAYGYVVQWRYPNGYWYNLGGTCYNNWVNVTNLDPCTSYEWRVQAICGTGYYSNWCNPCPFITLCNYNCPNPEWLTCMNITGYSATWKWAGCQGADYYSVQWCYPGGQWYDLAGGPFYGTWVNVTNLNPCTNYQFRVRSHCYYGGWSYNWCNPYSFTTLCNFCPAPTGLYSFDISDHQATLKWTPVYGAYTYSVQIRDVNNGTWYDVPGSPTTGVWIKAYNLYPCKTYEWRVRANCSYYESWSVWSKPKTFTTTCGSGCTPPQWEYTAGITRTSASLHWAPVSGADYYVVEWRLPGGDWNVLAGGPWTNTWADLTGLQPNTAYEWHVKSHCYGGTYSDWSSLTYFSTLGDVCGLPFYRFTLPITDSTATFHWSSVPGALNYTVQIREINGTWIDVAGSPTVDTAITAIGLTPNTQYEWQMQVNCSNGSYSNWLSAIKFTTGSSQGCNTPSNLFTDSLALTSASLTWDAVPGAETYSVEIRLLPSGAWNPVSGSPVDTNRIKVDGLSPFTAYEWRVRANCAGQLHSFWSAPVQFTTTDSPPCSAPGNLTSDSITNTTVRLHWSHVSGAQAYQVQIRLPNGAWVDIALIVGDTTILATGLTPNTTYEWHVRGKCDSGLFSNWSNVASFTTTGTSPSNDDCTNAQLLTVETDCVSTFGSNVGATPSAPPPVGGCPSNNYKDVWFKFTMPDVPNPAVTIRTTAGSLANAVMEVYTGSDCSIMSIITCEDNNDNGNGSSMPVINLTGTPNATIWVRVWGFDGSEGTFTICVFNYISFNYAGAANTASPLEGEPIVVPDEVAPDAIDAIDQPEVKISPNPVSDQLSVTVQQTDDSRVIGLRMMDLSGKTMISNEFEPVNEDQFKYNLDVSTLQPGMYVLQVQTTGKMIAQKVMVVR